MKIIYMFNTKYFVLILGHSARCVRYVSRTTLSAYSTNACSTFMSSYWTPPSNTTKKTANITTIIEQTRFRNSKLMLLQGRPLQNATEQQQAAKIKCVLLEETARHTKTRQKPAVVSDRLNITR